MEEKLKELLKKAYSPYFKYPVACIVKTKDGNLFNGVNVELVNGDGTCAERNAINNAICNGYKKGDIESVHILGPKNDIIPCFRCRQLMNEFLEEDAQIICYGKKIIKYKLKELCPYPFDL